MSLSAMSGDEGGMIFSQLCDALEPRIAVAFSSVSHGMRESTQAQRLQLRAEHEAAAALCLKVSRRSCKELREAKELFLTGGVGSDNVQPDNVQRLAEGLGAGALPAMTALCINGVHVGDAGASAIAAALGRGALPRLSCLVLYEAAIGDAGLVALAPVLRRLPALMQIDMQRNPLGDEGLAALVAPPPPAGALPQPTRALAKLEKLDLCRTHVTDAGCAALVAALDTGALPALTNSMLVAAAPAGAASNTAAFAVHEAQARSIERRSFERRRRAAAEYWGVPPPSPTLDTPVQTDF